MTDYPRLHKGIVSLGEMLYSNLQGNTATWMWHRREAAPCMKRI